MRVKHIRECSPVVPSSAAAGAARKASSLTDTKPDNYRTNATICRLVERYPCMYFRTHPYYLRKGVVEKAWEEISEEMGESIAACKERWRNIRTSFARSINVNKVPSTANRTKPYYLHEELQFLARHITPGIPVARRNYTPAEDSSFSDTSLRDESSLGFSAMKTDEDDSQEHCVIETVVGTSSDTAEEDPPKSPAQAPLLHLPRLTPRTIPMKPIEVDDDDDDEEVVDDGPVELDDSVAEPDSDASPSKKRQRLESEEASLPDAHDRNTKPLELGGFESDFDALFLQALLPEVKMMAFHQKILFKHRIYQALLEIFGGGVLNKPDPFSAASAAASAAMAAASGYSDPPMVTPIPPSMINVTTSDLYLLRRLGHLLQMPNTTVVNTEGTTAVHTVTKNMNSGTITVNANDVPISASSAGATAIRVSLPATVNAPIPASVRGTLTRSGSNMMRVTMVNTPNPLPIDVAAISQPLKEEPQDMLDD